MSRAQAEFFDANRKHIAWGIYCGTSDILQPIMADDQYRPWDWYYDRVKLDPDPWDLLAACEHPTHDGIAWADYGGGFYWPIQFCSKCRIVRGPADPWKWDAPEDEANAWIAEGWPKDGRP